MAQLRRAHHDMRRCSKMVGTLRFAHPTDAAAFRNKNTAAITSAMQFVRGLGDHTSLITRAREFVGARLAAAVAAGDR